MAETVFFALVEELTKLGIVSALKKAWLRIPSYFIFFAAESLMKWPEVYAHTQALGAVGLGAMVGAVSVVVGSSLFHVYTSILYANVRYVWPALIFCTILHGGWNHAVDLLPPFGLFWYVTGPWPIAIVQGLLVVGYWLIEKKLRRA